MNLIACRSLLEEQRNDLLIGAHERALPFGLGRDLVAAIEAEILQIIEAELLWIAKLMNASPAPAAELQVSA